MSLAQFIKRESYQNLDEEVIVLRHLPRNSTLKDIQDCLRDIIPISIELHRDEQGVFKGTVFVKLSSVEAQYLLQGGCILNGKKIRIEVMRRRKSTNSESRRNSFLSQRDNARVMKIESLVTSFIDSIEHETFLPVELDSEDRKIAHSIAERLNLYHITTIYSSSVESSDLEQEQKAVFLSKYKGSSHREGSLQSSSFASVYPPPGFGSSRQGMFEMDGFDSSLKRSSLNVDAPVFTPSSRRYSAESYGGDVAVEIEKVPEWVTPLGKNDPTHPLSARESSSSSSFILNDNIVWL